MDISLLVFAVDLPSSAYSLGDIVDVSARHYDGCQHQRFILVHVHGIPDNGPEDVQLRRLKEMFERQLTTEAFGEEVRRRAWRLDAPATAPSVMSELLATRETVIDWETAKVFLGKRVVSDIESPDSDALSFITDGDV